MLLSLLERKDIDDTIKADILNRMDKVYSQSERPKDIENTLWDITTRVEDSLASGSLSALTRINYHESAIDDQRLLNVAQELAFEQDSEPLTKITAIQVATHLKGDNTFPKALSIAMDDEAPQMVKIEALKSVVALGDQSAIDDLEFIMKQSSDPLVSKASELAIEVLSGRARQSP